MRLIIETTKIFEKVEWVTKTEESLDLIELPWDKVTKHDIERTK